MMWLQQLLQERKPLGEKLEERALAILQADKTPDKPVEFDIKGVTYRTYIEDHKRLVVQRLNGAWSHVVGKERQRVLQILLEE